MMLDMPTFYFLKPSPASFHAHLLLRLLAQITPSSFSRSSRSGSPGLAGPRLYLSYPAPAATAHCPLPRMESARFYPSTSHPDRHCPVCLQTASFPVQTNCGHLFCAPCLITYWRHGMWLDPISCPLCRQKVSAICHLFNDTRSDQQSKDVLGEITDYNKRYSGAPRRIRAYLCDAPVLLQLMVRSLGTIGVLVGLFFLRVALCCVGTVVSISSSSSSSSPSSSSMKADPSLCGLLGVLDDLVVVFLLLLCVINVNQRGHPASTGGVGS
uniref:RING-HC_RNF170 domain-containing protein n=1 Tax=Doryrhamphus excisus TaxID=161450 RepID=UPI0025AE35BC|nr:RING-HC_RNF170 domain-containing protein [Doryrhamphus excisus]